MKKDAQRAPHKPLLLLYTLARSELKPSEIQDLGDIMPKLLEIKNKANIPLAFRIQIELGDGENQPDDETVQSMNLLLSDIVDGFELEKEPDLSMGKIQKHEPSL